MRLFPTFDKFPNVAKRQDMSTTENNNQTCASTANANFTRNITIAGLDGEYMKVTLTDGLEFGNQIVEPTANLSVVPSPGRFQLISGFTFDLTGKYLNMACVMLANMLIGVCRRRALILAPVPRGFINILISGYQHQNGTTAFLSSVAGAASYKGSLAVKYFADSTCRVTVGNTDQ
ncbi:hypothetical protein DFH07DRAFT_769336 [Mycena maculata]|uniref:Uncharacterized protein n=1 Tax=Mycena maculata TaxID=230809 RepID=A0AAD7JN35_9AGAR|nr:hypothetical protein DFH07DRAFT_769336 [Mycena maculata]